MQIAWVVSHPPFAYFYPSLFPPPLDLLFSPASTTSLPLWHCFFYFLFSSCLLLKVGNPTAFGLPYPPYQPNLSFFRHHPPTPRLLPDTYLPPALSSRAFLFNTLTRVRLRSLALLMSCSLFFDVMLLVFSGGCRVLSLLDASERSTSHRPKASLLPWNAFR